MIIYRVGEGQTASGKIIDKETRWFNDYYDAVEYSNKTNKKIYRSINKQKYILIRK